MTEMVCVSPEGRITPGCPGLWTDEQRDAWARIVDFVHAHSTAKIGLQLGHSGRKGSTKLMWEGMDEPLPSGNWEVVGPSAAAVRDGEPRAPGADPRRPGGDQAEFVAAAAARRARRASTCSSCTAPTATCCPRSCRRCPTRAPTSTAARWRTGCGSRSRCSTRSARRGRPTRRSRVRISATDWNAGGNDARRRRRDRPGLHRARRGRHPRLDRAGRQGRAAGLRAQLPDAVRRPDPPRGGREAASR